MSLYFGGGFEEWLKKMVLILNDEYSVTVAYGSIGVAKLSADQVKRSYEPYAKLAPIKFINILNQIFIINFLSFIKLYKLFRESDVIYFNYAFFLQEVWIFLITRFTKKRVVVGFHSTLFFSPLHDMLFKHFSVLFLKGYAAFHVLTNRDMLSLEGLGFRNIYIIPNFVLSDSIKPLSAPSSPREYVFVGRYESMKGIDVLIEALTQYLEPDSGDSTFHFYGSGSWGDRLAELASQFPKRIYDHGYATDKGDIYRGKYALLMPSRAESFPLVFLEAMSFGVPIVTTPTNGGLEVVKNGVDGFVMSGFGTKDVLAGIGSIEALPQDQHSVMAKSVYASVGSEFTEKLAKKRFMELLGR